MQNRGDSIFNVYFKKGKGLGRNESGITAALKPKLKFDNRGIGHDESEQFTYHWWEHAYDKAASNIQVATTEEGVSVDVHDDDFDITTKKRSLKKLQKTNSLEYGTFLKTSTLSQGGKVTRIISEVAETPETCEPVATSHSLTDEDLFKICGGRTAHKGARHGLKQNGKLARIEEQEKILLEKLNLKNRVKNSVNHTHKKDVPTIKSVVKDDINYIKIKKKKKSKREKNEDNSLLEVPQISDASCDDINYIKIKKKKKSKREKNEDNSLLEVPQISDASCENNLSSISSSGSVEYKVQKGKDPVDEPSNAKLKDARKKPKKRKDKKRKLEDDCYIEEVEDDRRSKKKKKHHKISDMVDEKPLSKINRDTEVVAKCNSRNESEVNIFSKKKMRTKENL